MIPITEVDVLQTSLVSAITRTIENMTFEEVILVDKKQILPVEEQVLWAAVPIVSPYEGALIIEVPMEYGISAARCLFTELELDGDMSEDLLNDVLAEIINTIGGRFMTAIVSPSQTFKLGLPRSGKGKCPVSAKKIRSILLNVSDYFLMVYVVGEDFDTLPKTVIAE